MRRIELSRERSLIICCGVLSVVAVWLFSATCAASQEYAPPEDGFTRITIDGDPSDWARYPTAVTDPTGDSTGNVDLTYISAFANDAYLYVLCESAGEIGSYVQLDVDINPTAPDGWPPDFMINARPYEHSRLHLSRLEDEQFIHLGEHGYVAQGTALEMRIPLEAFELEKPTTFAVRVMDGVCCESQWREVDWTRVATILSTVEIEALPIVEIQAPLQIEVLSDVSPASVPLPALDCSAFDSVTATRQIDVSDLRWIRLGGPLGGLGYDIRMHPDNPDLMYVTDANAGIHMSTDGGGTWYASNDGIDLRKGSAGALIPTFCLTVDSNNPDRVWIGLQDLGGIYLSQDGGATWQRRTNGLKEGSGLTIRGFTVEPGNSDVVYTAGEVSSWTWAGEGLEGRMFDRVQGVVYKTTNGGDYWKEVWRGDNLARYVWIDPLNADVLYVSTGLFDREAADTNVAANEPGGVGILKSIDAGASWEVLNEENGLTGLYVGSLFMHPEDPDTLLAGAGHDYWSRAWDQGGLQISPAGVYLTSDGGETWVKTLDADLISSVEFAASDPQVAYAAGDHVFFRSRDGGYTWEQVGQGAGGDYWGPPGIVAGFPIDFQVDPRDPYRIFVNNYGGGNFVSEDGGETWTDASKGYTGADARAGLAVDPTDSGRVFSAAFSGLFVSGDGGRTWEGLAFTPARHTAVNAVAVSPSDPRLVLSSPWDLGPILARSEDGGYSWELVRVQPGERHEFRPFLDFAFAPSSPQIVYAACGSAECLSRDEDLRGCSQSGGGIYVSRDAGETWTSATDENTDNKPMAALAVDPRDANTLYAGVLGSGGVYKTIDGGKRWVRLPADLSTVRDIAVAPANPCVVYAAGGGPSGGIYRSEDAGETWSWAFAGLDPEAVISAIEVDPEDSMIVWAASLVGGVHLSTDGGRRWTGINRGLTNRRVGALALSSDGTTLYAGTHGGGAFRLSISGEKATTVQ